MEQVQVLAALAYMWYPPPTITPCWVLSHLFPAPGTLRPTGPPYPASWLLPPNAKGDNWVEYMREAHIQPPCSNLSGVLDTGMGRIKGQDVRGISTQSMVMTFPTWDRQCHRVFSWKLSMAILPTHPHPGSLWTSVKNLSAIGDVCWSGGPLGRGDDLLILG